MLNGFFILVILPWFALSAASTGVGEERDIGSMIQELFKDTLGRPFRSPAVTLVTVEVSDQVVDQLKEAHTAAQSTVKSKILEACFADELRLEKEVLKQRALARGELRLFHEREQWLLYEREQLFHEQEQWRLLYEEGEIECQRQNVTQKEILEHRDLVLRQLHLLQARYEIGRERSCDFERAGAQLEKAGMAMALVRHGVGVASLYEGDERRLEGLSARQLELEAHLRNSEHLEHYLKDRNVIHQQRLKELKEQQLESEELCRVAEYIDQQLKRSHVAHQQMLEELSARQLELEACRRAFLHTKQRLEEIHEAYQQGLKKISERQLESEELCSIAEYIDNQLERSRAIHHQKLGSINKQQLVLEDLRRSSEYLERCVVAHQHQQRLKEIKERQLLELEDKDCERIEQQLERPGVAHLVRSDTEMDAAAGVGVYEGDERRLEELSARQLENLRRDSERTNQQLERSSMAYYQELEGLVVLEAELENLRRDSEHTKQQLERSNMAYHQELEALAVLEIELENLLRNTSDSLGGLKVRKAELDDLLVAIPERIRSNSDNLDELRVRQAGLEEKFRSAFELAEQLLKDKKTDYFTIDAVSRLWRESDCQYNVRSVLDEHASILVFNCMDEDVAIVCVNSDIEKLVARGTPLLLSHQFAAPREPFTVLPYVEAGAGLGVSPATGLITISRAVHIIDDDPGRILVKPFIFKLKRDHLTRILSSGNVLSTINWRLREDYMNRGKNFYLQGEVTNGAGFAASVLEDLCEIHPLRVTPFMPEGNNSLLLAISASRANFNPSYEEGVEL